MKTLQHIVIICAGCGGNGAVANVALHQAHELAKCFRVTLASDGFPEKRDKNIHYVLIQSPKYTWLRRYSHVLREYAFTRHVKRQLEVIHASDPIDLIISQSHPVTALTSKPLQKKYGIKSVLVTHGDIFDRPKGTYDFRLTWFYKSVTLRAYLHADLVIALSPYMKDMAINGGAVPDYVQVIPNGIDPEEIGLDQNTLPPPVSNIVNHFELLYVGRLSVEKGVDILIEACGFLKRRGISFRLRVCGDGPERSNLENCIKKLQLEDCVKFIGQMKRAELGKLYRSCHLVCVPSRSDSLPTVVLEAMVAGIPVLGTKTGGIPFMIDGSNGFIVGVEDAESLADAIYKISNDRNQLILMREVCIAKAQRELSWEQNGNNLKDKISNLLDRM